jgi:hypothetical protein
VPEASISEKRSIHSQNHKEYRPLAKTATQG